MSFPGAEGNWASDGSGMLSFNGAGAPTPIIMVDSGALAPAVMGNDDIGASKVA